MTAFNDARQRLGCSYISHARFDKRRSETALKLELHLCALDYSKYPLQELKKLYEYLFGETTVFCNQIEAKRNLWKL